MSIEASLPTAREIAESCLCFYTQRAARSLARRFDTAFRPLGITNGQFSLMAMLSGADERRMKDVADFLKMDRTTLTAAIKALQRQGLATVSTDAKDRRSRLISLTAAGRATLARAKPIWRSEHVRLEQEKSEVDPIELRRMLKALA